MCCLIQPLIHWVGIHQVLVGWLSVFSIITFFGTLLIIPIMVVRLPEDYFLYDKAHLKEFRRQHPFIRVLSGIFKNILGYLFILAGIAMLFLPGQGILTILIGITLISFPKKRALELWFIRHESIHQALNWMRAKAGKPYLRLQ
jgi:hypothetical protein